MAIKITAAVMGLTFFFNVSADISRENFIRNFIQPFQVEACQKAGIISQCFKVNDKQCIKQTSRAYSICQQQIKVPDVIKSVHESRVWGANLAICVVQQFKSAHPKLFINNHARCEGIK